MAHHLRMLAALKDDQKLLPCTSDDSKLPRTAAPGDLSLCLLDIQVYMCVHTYTQHTKINNNINNF